MKSSPLWVLLMVFLGSIAGSFCTYLFFHEAGTTPEVGRGSTNALGETHLESSGSIDELRHNFSTLEANLAQSMEQLERAFNNRPVQRTALPKSKPGPVVQVDWTSVLDKRVTKAFVVRGLSPFARPAVADAVRKAEEDLVDARLDATRRHYQIEEQEISGRLNDDDSSRAYAASKELYAEAQASALAAFEAELDRLRE